MWKWMSLSILSSLFLIVIITVCTWSDNLCYLEDMNLVDFHVLSWQLFQFFICSIESWFILRWYCSFVVRTNGLESFSVVIDWKKKGICFAFNIAEKHHSVLLCDSSSLVWLRIIVTHQREEQDGVVKDIQMSHLFKPQDMKTDQSSDQAHSCSC
jgi:hypothetical protein